MMEGPQKITIWECTGSYEYVLYGDKTKIKLAENLRLEKFILPRVII